MIAVLGAIVAAAFAVHYVLVSWAGGQLVFAAAGVVAAVLAVRVGWWFAFPGRRLPRNRVRAMRIRVRLGLRPGPGHATGVECWWRWGRFAAFRRSGRARRSLPAWRRYWRPSEHSFLAGRAYRAHRQLVPSEEHAVVMAPPRARKTGWVAKVILNWPGPVVATSTKCDLFALTSGIRSLVGPVHVFNPQAIGGVLSTFRWNPIRGCEVVSVAIRRADAFAHAVSQKGVEDATFWAGKASDYLRAYFHAAALAGGDMRLVTSWVLSHDTAGAEEVLRRHGSDEWAAQLAQLRGQAAKTAETIRMTMSRALAFMGDPALAASVLPSQGHGLDIGEFLAADGTLYLVAEAADAGGEAPVAPLFACMAAEIRHIAALAGSVQPGGRLDPPLLMGLDEATQICPCPIPSWLADSGGKGITIITVCHGEAQLADRWGEHGKQTILDTSGVKIWLPGITATATLEAASKLAGDTAYTEHGQEHATRHPIMTGAMVRQLPAGYALVIRGGLSPVIMRIPVAWQDLRYLLARLRGRAVAEIHAAPPVDATIPVADAMVAAGPWPPGEGFRPAPVSPGAPHPWNKTSTARRANGNGHDGNGHAGEARDGR
jgi:type IV secretion system protein VirD4